MILLTNSEERIQLTSIGVRAVSEAFLSLAAEDSKFMRGAKEIIYEHTHVKKVDIYDKMWKLQAEYFFKYKNK